jgi:excinuclease ABC subunit C
MQAIPGIGPKRSMLLLRQFGGLKGLSRAGLEDLAAVPGISQRMATVVYHHFHPDAMP